MATRKKTTRRPGRPAGSKTRQHDHATAEPSRCRCGSTDREPYSQTIVTEYGGEFNGQPFTHIVRRWTKCAACGQARVDKSHENRTAGRNGTKENP